MVTFDRAVYERELTITNNRRKRHAVKCLIVTYATSLRRPTRRDVIVPRMLCVFRNFALRRSLHSVATWRNIARESRGKADHLTSCFIVQMRYRVPQHAIYIG